MDVWRIDLRQRGPLDAWLALLDARERAQAGRFRFEIHARAYIVAHAATRCILAHYTRRAPQHLGFVSNAYGKPALDHGDAPVFNLSHSGELALCAVAADGELGVDIEQQRVIGAGELAGRFFPADEAARLARVDAHDTEAAFFRCWTRKEAYIKARGLGLSLPLEQFSVEFDAGRPAALLTSDYAPADVAHFRMWDLAAGAGYQAALAYAGADRGAPVLRDWIPDLPAITNHLPPERTGMFEHASQRQ